jgi:glycerol-3-phosphate dehydrogenase (NAD(P)+)
MRTVVVGCGAWGTTLAHLMASNGDSVALLCHDQAIIDEIRTERTNKQVLPGDPRINKSVTPTPMSDLATAVSQADLVCIVVAASFYRSVLRDVQAVLPPQAIILSATKGVETLTNRSVLEIASEELSASVFKERFVVLSGPNLATEIFIGLPAATVLACQKLDTAKKIQSAMSSSLFRAYVSEDVIGVEYGGILKNIIAIAAGILDAQSLGSNAKSALLVRGMAEMRRYALHEGAKEETLYGLSGFGDLITTCLGPQSRNYTVGFRLGKGESLESILGSMSVVAEGVNACRVVAFRSRKMGVPMPITEAIAAVLQNNMTIDRAIKQLMTRSLKVED